MILAKAGDWVEIQNLVPNSENIARHILDDAKEAPLVQWLRGFLLTKEAAIGDEVVIETMIGRNAKGCLCAVNPRYEYDFGEPIKELIEVKMELQREIEELKNSR